MKSWLIKLKKIGKFLIGSATLGLPTFTLVSLLIDIREDYSNLQIWLPIHPFTAVIARAFPYLAASTLIIYLYRKKRHLGEIKIFVIVLIVLVLAFLIQLLLSFYTINYR